MKILKPGRIQTGWAKEKECTGKGNGDGGCGATLLVEEGDLFQTSSCHQGEVDNFVTFKCGACGVLTDIDDAPAHVVGKLPTKPAWMEAHTPAPTYDPRD